MKIVRYQLNTLYIIMTHYKQMKEFELKNSQNTLQEFEISAFGHCQIQDGKRHDKKICQEINDNRNMPIHMQIFSRLRID